MCFLLNLSFDLIHGIQTSKQASGSKATARQKQARSEQQERQAFVFSLFSFFLFWFCPETRRHSYGYQMTSGGNWVIISLTKSGHLKHFSTYAEVAMRVTPLSFVVVLRAYGSRCFGKQAHSVLCHFEHSGLAWFRRDNRMWKLPILWEPTGSPYEFRDISRTSCRCHAKPSHPNPVQSQSQSPSPSSPS
jgi:hypothetical protein